MTHREEQADRLPLLPLKEVVIFPRMVTPLLVGRPSSVSAVEEALSSERPLFLCAQRDASVESPSADDLYDIGVAASILQTLRMPDGTMKVVVEGLARGEVLDVLFDQDHIEAMVRQVSCAAVVGEKATALHRTVLAQFEEYVRLGQRVAPEIVASLRSVSEPGDFADLICAYLSLSLEERQLLLSITDEEERLEQIASILMRENEMLELERRVRDRVRDQMDRSQRDHFLHEQLRAIHQELGTRDEGPDEFAEMRELLDKTKMPKEVREKAEREMARYERMPPLSPESTVVRTYLEWLVDMPWNKRSRDSLNIEEARKILDEDHYGLPKVKERILEFLAVRKLSKSTKGPVLCLVGPPGVGKTSLGKSIARAMGRKFVRVSLGGVRDEAEIRGHRRTYVGALPGRIIQNVKRVGVRNPVFMLDEIDKLSMDYRGDPSSALLEVLDPEQNNAFSDHYLEVDFNLAEVFFITTANNEYDIPHGLHDRMEVVRISGYTSFEKQRIAQGFLVPKQLKEAGLSEEQVKFEPSGIDRIIQRYTREAGVRELERQIARVCRKVARQVVEESAAHCGVIDAEVVSKLLGPEEYPENRAEAMAMVGVAVGLAWTWAGGDILSIETSISRGKGEITLTGQLGDVMKESAQAAFTYLRTHAAELGIPARFNQTNDIHVHIPEGAIPKDGPSAGTALAVSMLSALKKKAPEPFFAVTGEVTLRGRVLQVGGIKEKVLGAHRAGIRTVVLPKENEKDLVDVPEEVRDDLAFVFVENIDEVFKAAFPTLKKSSATRKKSAAKKPSTSRTAQK